MFRGGPVGIAVSAACLGGYAWWAYRKEMRKYDLPKAEDWKLEDTKMWNQQVLQSEKTRKADKERRKRRKELRDAIIREQQEKIEEFRNSPELQREYRLKYGETDANLHNSLHTGVEKALGRPSEP